MCGVVCVGTHAVLEIIWETGPKLFLFCGDNYSRAARWGWPGDISSPLLSWCLIKWGIINILQRQPLPASQHLYIWQDKVGRDQFSNSHAAAAAARQTELHRNVESNFNNLQPAAAWRALHSILASGRWGNELQYQNKKFLLQKYLKELSGLAGWFFSEILQTSKSSRLTVTCAFHSEIRPGAREPEIFTANFALLKI